MGVVNVLLGACLMQDGVDITSRVSEMMRADLEAAGVRVGIFDYVSTQDGVELGIKSNKYDVVICQEVLSGARIGGGSVGKWIALNPHVRFILLIDPAKKGGSKLQNIFSKYSYYDALYNSELTGVNLAQLIAKSRTKEEAVLYYGLSLSTDDERASVVEEVSVESVGKDKGIQMMDVGALRSGSQSHNEVSASDDAVATGVNEAAGAALGSSTEVQENFDEMMRGMAELFSSAGGNTQEETTMPVEDFKVEDNKPVDKDNMNLLEGEDVLTNTIRNRRFGDDATEKMVLEEYEKQEQELNLHNEYGSTLEDDLSANEGGYVNSFELAVAENCYKQYGNKLHIKGAVVGIIDESLIMVVFEKPLIFKDIKGVSNFGFTFLVPTKEKGHFENGRYKTGLLTIKGYGNCMIDDYTAVVETVDVDLYGVREQLINQSSNIILAKQ